MKKQQRNKNMEMMAREKGIRRARRKKKVERRDRIRETLRKENQDEETLEEETANRVRLQAMYGKDLKGYNGAW